MVLSCLSVCDTFSFKWLLSLRISGFQVYIHSPSEIPLAEINGININHGSAGKNQSKSKQENQTLI